ncbi:MAG: ThuA domain-containing protein, partial [Calditrichaeota bacterium]
MKLKHWIVYFIAGLGSIVRPVYAGDKVLIYTRNGEGYVHDNIAASVAALQRICVQHHWETEVTDDPQVFTDQSLQQFIAVIFSNSNNQAFISDEQRLAFVRYIQAGGAFVGIHSACASERMWPWFWSMIGGRFVRHPVLQSFDIAVIDPEHPSTHFLSNPWKWEDECYFIDHLNPDIRVLLAVDLRTLQ